MLTLNNIYANYGSSPALRGVSLDVGDGQLVALLGANGAGKTTTLLTVMGVLKPARGSIRFAGEDIAGLTPEANVRKGIAMVPENREIFSGLTVEQNLRLGAFVRYDRVRFRRDLDEMVTLFPVLGERMRKPAGTLSGGQQQQLAIARALVSHPRLLMLDEPSLGLAPRLVAQVFALVARMRAEGQTILLVEQNVTQTLEIVDYAYLMDMGRIEVAGTPEELRKRVDLTTVYLGSEWAEAAS